VEIIHQVAHNKALPPEVVEQIVAKTDGVPLFVEELTKMVLESGLLQEGEDRYELTGPLPPLAIPATLYDSLMARLDRLAAVKAMMQLGATLGREFSYELFQAVSPWDEETVQRGLYHLVEAEFLYQRGLPPLLKSTRQQHHQRITQVLEARFPETVETQPELLAQHYTEASLMTQASPYWQRAGQRAIQRSAHLEAISHLTKGLLVDQSEERYWEAEIHRLKGELLLASSAENQIEGEACWHKALDVARRQQARSLELRAAMSLSRL
jgi:predicted ATPase